MIPVLAHGVGGRSDLPLPVWLFSYGAAFAVVIGFVALGMLWTRPRLAQAAAGRALPEAVDRAAGPAAMVLRVLGLLVFGVVLYAGLWGADERGANIAPYVIYVSFWVGMQIVAAVFGDLWRALNPFDTIALVVTRGRGAARSSRPDPGLWPAALMLLSFAWLELCYHEPAAPRSVGVWLLVYSAATLAGALWWGRGWLRDGEGFAALFGLLSTMSPFFRDAGSSRLRVRWPVTGLATVRTRPGLDVLIFVVLGSTTFDGVTRLDWWSRDVLGTSHGWERTAVQTVGLLLVVSLVAFVWLAATRVSARATDDDPFTVANAYVPSLIPIVLAYAIAHYFSLVFYESYNVVALASDPFGRGWDLFGTIDVAPDYRLLSTTLIAWVQAGAIVAGHLAGVLAAHDRSLERHPDSREASRSQRPLIAAMVVYTVAGLSLLLGA
ncbi:MAG: hypothetical protein ACT452_05740 [Microthrixaceae bacterium]